MRYASIRNLDISNGANIGVALFVQGCDRNPHCKNCFNSETWDFNGGKEWTEKTKNKFMELIDRPYIKRISILGGEPLAEQNLDDVLSLIKEIREKYPISQNHNSENIGKSRVLEDENSKEIRNSFPNKTIWLYTGYKFEQIKDAFIESKKWLQASWKHSAIIRWEIISNVDVLVDGEYIDEQKDLTLKWCGSRNQHVIDVKQSMAQNKMVLYCD
jgi:anaerobic ribonucleoside-triphosphate reductase activating protein|nr:MAG TPA: 4Fe-4S single cluster domain protein [Caudoviricetes sp.]